MQWFNRVLVTKLTRALGRKADALWGRLFSIENTLADM
jgi:hypothetical protein